MLIGGLLFEFWLCMPLSVFHQLQLPDVTCLHHDKIIPNLNSMPCNVFIVAPSLQQSCTF